MKHKRIFSAVFASILTLMPLASLQALAEEVQAVGEVAQASYNAGSFNDNIPLRGRVSTIPKGTNMLIKLDQPISSFSSNPGDAVEATLENDVFINDSVAIPAGSQVVGQVSNVTRSGRIGKHGEMNVHFFSAKTPDGIVVPLRASIVTKDNTGILKGDTFAMDLVKGVGLAAGSTGLGAVLGTAFGGLLGVAGAGAVFGTALGGIGGITYALTRKGKDVVIPSGARMNITVDQPVNINL